MGTYEKSLLKSAIALVTIAVVFLFLFQLGVFNANNNLEIPNTSKVDSVIIKDQTETKKLQIIVDSVTKENKRLEAIIKRKESFISKTLKQNEINKTITHEFPDTIAYYFNDSVRARYKEMFIEGRDRH
jgi:hypothetical protein